MHFGTKSYLKSNRNHTTKQTQLQTQASMDPFFRLGAQHGPSILLSCLKLLLNTF